MGTTANQKRLFFNLRKAKSQISALDEGDLRPDQVKQIATKLGVHGAGRRRDEPPPRRRCLAQRAAARRRRGRRRVAGLAGRRQRQTRKSAWPSSEEADNRHVALRDAMGVLNERERRIFEARRLADDPITLEELSDGVRRLARARPPDRGARLREGPEGGARSRRPAGSRPPGAARQRLRRGRASRKARGPGQLRSRSSRGADQPPCCQPLKASLTVRSPVGPFSNSSSARRPFAKRSGIISQLRCRSSSMLR